MPIETLERLNPQPIYAHVDDVVNNIKDVVGKVE